jgi:hypothetical protein
MSKDLTLMQIHNIRKDSELFSPVELADIYNIALSTVYKVLNGEAGKKQRTKADRMEALLGGVVPDDGNYRARCLHYEEDGYDEDGYESSREALTKHSDPTFEEVALWEELENL